MKEIQVVPSAGLSIPLGVEGEHRARSIEFDCSALASDYGPGTAAVFHQREQDGDALPIAVEQDGDLVTWIVTNADTECPSGSPSPIARGKVVIEWIVGETVAKTLTMKTMVVRSITTATETPPEPVAYWYAALVKAIEEAGSSGTVDPEAIAEAVQAYLTDNPIEAPVTSVNAQTGDVTLTAEDVGAMSRMGVPDWVNSSNPGTNDAMEIIMWGGMGMVSNGSPDNSSAPTLVISGNLSYGYRDFLAIDGKGKIWSGNCNLQKPEITRLEPVYPTPEDIGAATPDDVTAAAQEAVEASKALGMTGAEVGQIAKITAVDDSGVPTAWEAVDMPSAVSDDHINAMIDDKLGVIENGAY